MAHWKKCKRGENLIFGTIQNVERLTPKSNWARLLVHGHQHVGIYKFNLAVAENRKLDITTQTKPSLNLYVDKDMVPTRLYINATKIWEVSDQAMHHTRILRIMKMFVPYQPQGTFSFVHPWESNHHRPDS